MVETNLSAHRRCVLLVEDSPRLGALIREYMGGHGIEVVIEPDGASAVQRFMAERPSLVILDIMLPGKDGYQICRQLRSMSTVPILIYTARREDIDHVLGLELGADDYVVKPLEPRVLLARIEALLRRAGNEQAGRGRDGMLTRGPIAVNRSARLVTHLDQRVQLTPTDFDLFWVLFSHCGDLVTRDELERVLRRVPYDGVGRTIDSRIFRLRKKFEQAGAPADLILSVRSKGYLLAVEETVA
jgi:DNA-binding response OmpR family regulator